MLLSTLGTLTLGYFGLLWATLGYFGLLLATFLTICVTYGSIIQCDFLKKNKTTKHYFLKILSRGNLNLASRPAKLTAVI